MFGLLLSLACGDDDGSADAAADTSADVSSDGAAEDASADATRDSSPGEDAGGSDASEDASIDGSNDASIDAGEDAEVDSGPVSMPCTPSGECDPFMDDTGCEDGQVCIVAAGGTECRDAGDGLALGEVCTQRNDCAPGLMCVRVGEGDATCQAMCAAGSIGQCEGEARCFGNVGDACVQFCRPRSPSCDIYTQDCAGVDEACTLVTDPETDERYTGCRPAGEKAQGETCGGDDGNCEAGLVCIRRDGTSTCHEVCDADAGETCSEASEVCEGVSSSWRVTYCRPPRE